VSWALGHRLGEMGLGAANHVCRAFAVVPTSTEPGAFATWPEELRKEESAGTEDLLVLLTMGEQRTTSRIVTRRPSGGRPYWQPST
jgi:hypothetical protein